MWVAARRTARTVTTRPELPPGARHLVRDDGSVIVPAAVASEVLRALVRDLTARVHADGGEVSAEARRVLYALHEAAERREREVASSDVGTLDPQPATVELTAQQAASLLECSPEYARRLARSGRLRARRAGLVWLIDSASMEAYRKGHHPCHPSSPNGPA